MKHKYKFIKEVKIGQIYRFIYGRYSYDYPVVVTHKDEGGLCTMFYLSNPDSIIKMDEKGLLTKITDYHYVE